MFLFISTAPQMGKKKLLATCAAFLIQKTGVLAEVFPDMANEIHNDYTPDFIATILFTVSCRTHLWSLEDFKAFVLGLDLFVQLCFTRHWQNYLCGHWRCAHSWVTGKIKTAATIGCCYSSHHLKRRPFLLPQTPLFFVRLNLQTGPLLQAGDGDGGGGRWQLWQGPPKGQKRFLKSGRQEFHNPSLSDWGICLLNIQLFLLAKCPLKSSCNCVGKKETKQEKWEGWV